jgi:hypothetical protein
VLRSVLLRVMGYEGSDHGVPAPGVAYTLVANPDAVLTAPPQDDAAARRTLAKRPWIFARPAADTHTAMRAHVAIARGTDSVAPNPLPPPKREASNLPLCCVYCRRVLLSRSGVECAACLRLAKSAMSSSLQFSKERAGRLYAESTLAAAATPTDGDTRSALGLAAKRIDLLRQDDATPSSVVGCTAEQRGATAVSPAHHPAVNGRAGGTARKAPQRSARNVGDTEEVACVASYSASRQRELSLRRAEVEKRRERRLRDFTAQDEQLQAMRQAFEDSCRAMMEAQKASYLRDLTFLEEEAKALDAETASLQLRRKTAPASRRRQEQESEAERHAQQQEQVAGESRERRGKDAGTARKAAASCPGLGVPFTASPAILPAGNGGRTASTADAAGAPKGVQSPARESPRTRAGEKSARLERGSGPSHGSRAAETTVKELPTSRDAPSAKRKRVAEAAPEPAPGHAAEDAIPRATGRASPPPGKVPRLDSPRAEPADPGGRPAHGEGHAPVSTAADAQLSSDPHPAARVPRTGASWQSANGSRAPAGCAALVHVDYANPGVVKVSMPCTSSLVAGGPEVGVAAPAEMPAAAGALGKVLPRSAGAVKKRRAARKIMGKSA